MGFRLALCGCLSGARLLKETETNVRLPAGEGNQGAELAPAPRGTSGSPGASARGSELQQAARPVSVRAEVGLAQPVHQHPPAAVGAASQSHKVQIAELVGQGGRGPSEPSDVDLNPADAPPNPPALATESEASVTAATATAAAAVPAPASPLPSAVDSVGLSSSRSGPWRMLQHPASDPARPAPDECRSFQYNMPPVSMADAAALAVATVARVNPMPSRSSTSHQGRSVSSVAATLASTSHSRPPSTPATTAAVGAARQPSALAALSAFPADLPAQAILDDSSTVSISSSDDNDDGLLSPTGSAAAAAEAYRAAAAAVAGGSPGAPGTGGAVRSPRFLPRQNAQEAAFIRGTLAALKQATLAGLNNVSEAEVLPGLPRVWPGQGNHNRGPAPSLAGPSAYASVSGGGVGLQGPGSGGSTQSGLGAHPRLAFDAVVHEANLAAIFGGTAAADSAAGTAASVSSKLQVLAQAQAPSRAGSSPPRHRTLTESHLRSVMGLGLELSYTSAQTGSVLGAVPSGAQSPPFARGPGAGSVSDSLSSSAGFNQLQPQQLQPPGPSSLRPVASARLQLLQQQQQQQQQEQMLQHYRQQQERQRQQQQEQGLSRALEPPLAVPSWQSPGPQVQGASLPTSNPPGPPAIGPPHYAEVLQQIFARATAAQQQMRQLQQQQQLMHHQQGSEQQRQQQGQVLSTAALGSAVPAEAQGLEMMGDGVSLRSLPLPVPASFPTRGAACEREYGESAAPTPRVPVGSGQLDTTPSCSKGVGGPAISGRQRPAASSGFPDAEESRRRHVSGGGAAGRCRGEEPAAGGGRMAVVEGGAVGATVGSMAGGSAAGAVSATNAELAGTAAGHPGSADVGGGESANSTGTSRRSTTEATFAVSSGSRGSAGGGSADGTDSAAAAAVAPATPQPPAVSGAPGHDASGPLAVPVLLGAAAPPLPPPPSLAVEAEVSAFAQHLQTEQREVLAQLVRDKWSPFSFPLLTTAAPPAVSVRPDLATLRMQSEASTALVGLMDPKGPSAAALGGGGVGADSASNGADVSAVAEAPLLRPSSQSPGWPAAAMAAVPLWYESQYSSTTSGLGLFCGTPGLLWQRGAAAAAAAEAAAMTGAAMRSQAGGSASGGAGGAGDSVDPSKSSCLTGRSHMASIAPTSPAPHRSFCSTVDSSASHTQSIAGASITVTHDSSCTEPRTAREAVAQMMALGGLPQAQAAGYGIGFRATSLEALPLARAASSLLPLQESSPPMQPEPCFGGAGSNQSNQQPHVRHQQQLQQRQGYDDGADGGGAAAATPRGAGPAGMAEAGGTAGNAAAVANAAAVTMRSAALEGGALAGTAAAAAAMWPPALRPSAAAAAAAAPPPPTNGAPSGADEQYVQPAGVGKWASFFDLEASLSAALATTGRLSVAATAGAATASGSATELSAPVTAAPHPQPQELGGMHEAVSPQGLSSQISVLESTPPASSAARENTAAVEVLDGAKAVAGDASIITHATTAASASLTGAVAAAAAGSGDAPAVLTPAGGDLQYVRSLVGRKWSPFFDLEASLSAAAAAPPPPAAPPRPGPDDARRTEGATGSSGMALPMMSQLQPPQQQQHVLLPQPQPQLAMAWTAAHPAAGGTIAVEPAAAAPPPPLPLTATAAAPARAGHLDQLSSGVEASLATATAPTPPPLPQATNAMSQPRLAASWSSREIRPFSATTVEPSGANMQHLRFVVGSKWSPFCDVEGSLSIWAVDRELPGVSAANTAPPEASSEAVSPSGVVPQLPQLPPPPPPRQLQPLPQPWQPDERGPQSPGPATRALATSAGTSSQYAEAFLEPLRAVAGLQPASGAGTGAQTAAAGSSAAAAPAASGAEAPAPAELLRSSCGLWLGGSGHHFRVGGSGVEAAAAAAATLPESALMTRGSVEAARSLLAAASATATKVEQQLTCTVSASGGGGGDGSGSRGRPPSQAAVSTVMEPGSSGGLCTNGRPPAAFLRSDYNPYPAC